MDVVVKYVGIKSSGSVRSILFFGDNGLNWISIGVVEEFSFVFFFFFDLFFFIGLLYLISSFLF